METKLKEKMASYKTQVLLHASAIPVTPGAPTVDASGIQMFEWSHPLKSPGDCCGEATESRYSSCACFALAQIESRMGIAAFESSLRVYIPLMTLTFVIAFFTPWFIRFGDGVSPTSIAILVVGMLALVANTSIWWVRRTAKARTLVRERFQIPGTAQEDGHVACWQSTRMLRQMVRHLQCEQAGTFGRVDTLPAYAQ